MLESSDQQVDTAVEFLRQVRGKGLKGHKEGDLRNYLRYRRHLTKAQIDLAFKIYNYGINNPMAKPSAERQEVPIAKIASGGYYFLLLSNRARGIDVITNFLTMECNYCEVLECLIEEYYKNLGMMADQKQISISRKELEPIFVRISNLFSFHKKLYVDLKSRKDKFGQLFVRNFDGFREYVEYIKDCNKIIWKMREYIYDKSLRKALEHVRSTCRRPSDDMMDLVLFPIFRIKDYKKFIDDLYSLADKNWKKDYEYLGKASRRIGRVVRWVDIHKHGIINKNEMNRVQQFLDTQCNIIIPHRRIVRRGMMIRRTTTLLARNKRYLFFLFNDILLWTTRKGELQNLVFLQDCEVRASGSKSNQARKFEIVARGQRYKYYKHLKLECKDARQRNEWYDAVKKEVTAVKDVSTKHVKTNKFVEADVVKYLENILEEPKTPNSGFATPEKFNNHNEDEQSDTLAESEEDGDEHPVHRRVQSERNFEAHDFNDTFLGLEEMSATSENEQDLLLETEDKYGHSMGLLLFPKTKEAIPKGTSIVSVNKIQEQKSMSTGHFLNKGDSSTETIIPSYSDVPSRVNSFSGSVGQPESRIIINNSPINSYPSSSTEKKRSVIYRQGQSPSPTYGMAINSSFTIRLNTFD